VRFAFSEDQLAFRDAVTELLEKECPASEVRRAWENGNGRTDRAWAALGEMGVLGALAPESRGGLGLRAIDVVLLAEATGCAALPEPFVEHALVAAPIVPDLPGTVTAALGPATLVPYADSADAVLVEDDERLLLIDRAALIVEPRPSVDHSRHVAVVDWDTGRGAVTEVGGPEALARAFERGALGTAAQLLGLAQALLDTTVEYASERRQFGVPIGSQQAIKHKLADVRVGLEFARPLVARAANSLTHDEPGAAVDVSMAKARAGDVAALAARHALQCHGAIGYSFEHDLHLWMKRVWALVASWGDSAWHRERVARAILDRTT
jgi:alkylation response protein AidB-like acyl-CoA dehydrogenase